MMTFDQDNNQLLYGASGVGASSPSHDFTGHITASGDISSSGAISASKFIGSVQNLEAFEEDENGDLMPVDSKYINNHYWMVTGSLSEELCLRPNYFIEPAAASLTEEELSSLIFG